MQPHPVDIDISSWHQVLLDEGGLAGCGGQCGHQLVSRTQMTERGQRSGCGRSPPGYPTVTTTSALGLRRKLDSGV